jgi:hypothetical protein
MEIENEANQSRFPDVRVIEHTAPSDGTGGVAVAERTTVAEPYIYHVRDDPETQKYVEIRDVRSGHKVITVIEVVSPSNKAEGEARRAYQEKQKECRAAHASLVEIDLLRGGTSVVLLPRHQVVAKQRAAYQVCIFRGWQPLQLEYIPVSLRQLLPSINVPLRQTDRDVVLDLQALITTSYRNGGYETVDYRKPPEPPLEPDDAAWADALLKSKGLR